MNEPTERERRMHDKALRALLEDKDTMTPLQETAFLQKENHALARRVKLLEKQLRLSHKKYKQAVTTVKRIAETDHFGRAILIAKKALRELEETE